MPYMLTLDPPAELSSSQPCRKQHAALVSALQFMQMSSETGWRPLRSQTTARRQICGLCCITDFGVHVRHYAHYYVMKSQSALSTAGSEINRVICTHAAAGAGDVAISAGPGDVACITNERLPTIAPLSGQNGRCNRQIRPRTSREISFLMVGHSLLFYNADIQGQHCQQRKMLTYISALWCCAIDGLRSSITGPVTMEAATLALEVLWLSQMASQRLHAL